MTEPFDKQRDSTTRYLFEKDTIAEKPRTNKPHRRLNRTISVTVFQTPSRAEKAPGLTNGLRYLRWGGGRRSRPARKKLRRVKLLGMCTESPASGAPRKSGAHFSRQKPSG